MEGTYSNALLIALAQARRAVELDTIGEDSQGAIDAYKRSTTLIMGAITMMQNEEKMHNAVKTKAMAMELRKLVEIHDKYLARMEILCEVLGLPLPV
jgi:hypothetical protein